MVSAVRIFYYKSYLILHLNTSFPRSSMTTGGASSSGADTSPKKKGWPKGRKRRLLPKDSNAPKGPLSGESGLHDAGYMLFMGDQREVLRQTQPGLAFHEITKLVAQRWAALDQIAKTKYLEAAEADKERYQKEMEEYQKTDAYKNFLQKQRKAETPSPPKKTRKENGEERKEEEEEEEESSTSLLSTVREGELRQLRKSNTDYEEQNAILQKHIESMKSTVERLESETSQQRSNNAALQQHIETLRRTLARAFINLPLPGSEAAPTEETIDSYMVQLHSLIVNNPQQHQGLIQTVRGIVSQLALT
ncbi:High mobility group protein 20A [Portunus trituberculatus]|uniref:High mobility group protein 20A n=1 Tax=Portunus trituberculatus TaxID=210409 RepID=A0A5B7CYW2_PORTR|nr:High mobility group protein 20A [Portunus trituberculatus]